MHGVVFDNVVIYGYHDISFSCSGVVVVVLAALAQYGLDSVKVDSTNDLEHPELDS